MLPQTVTVQLSSYGTLAKLPGGEYTMHVYAPPYAPTEIKFVLAQDGQQVPVTLKLPALDFSNLVLINNELVNYQTGATIAPINALGGFGASSENIFFRQDAPDRYLMMDTNATGVAQYFLDGAFDTQLQLPDTQPGRAFALYLSSDNKQAVYVSNNDLWLADIDWNTLHLVNSHQVTQVGLFDQLRNTFFLWHNNTILSGIQNGVRVDLETGTVTEEKGLYLDAIPWRTSPDKHYVLGKGRIYDIETGKWLDMPDLTQMSDFIWLTNQRFAVKLTNGNKISVAIYEQDHATFKRKATIAGSFEGYRSYGQSGFYNVSPSGKYVFTLATGGDEKSMLINSEDGKAVELAKGAEQLQWLDDSHLVFSRTARTQGFAQVSIEEQGTWLYDATSKKFTKITPYPAESLVVLPENKAIVFVANNNLWYVGMDGKNLHQVTKTGNMRYKKLQKPKLIDLSIQK